mgnify:CR=1 FL=1
MLVLSRKVGESFVIGDQIAVTVVRVSGGVVRLGIEAPLRFTVMRAELMQLADQPARHQAIQSATGADD